jgi:hypothetical protein
MILTDRQITISIPDDPDGREFVDILKAARQGAGRAWNAAEFIRRAVRYAMFHPPEDEPVRVVREMAARPVAQKRGRHPVRRRRRNYYER